MFREVVISEAKSLKSAVFVNAGRGVVVLWVRTKAESQFGVGVRNFDAASWAAICAVSVEV